MVLILAAAMLLILLVIVYFWVSYIRLSLKYGMRPWLRASIVLHSVVTIAYGMIFIVPLIGFITLVLFFAIEIQVIKGIEK